MMSDKLTNLLKLYFPGFDVWASRINDKSYLVVDGFVSYVLKESGKIVDIIDMTLLNTDKDIVYRDKKLGIEYDSSYSMHAIINIIILAKDLYDVHVIKSNNEYFNKYLSHIYDEYIQDSALYISDLVNTKSEKFPYLTMSRQIYRTNETKIGYNVSYYPPMEVLQHHRSFSIIGAVIPFDPFLQNARVLIRGVKYVPISIYNGVLLQLLKNWNISDNMCIDIIDKYFERVDSDMVSTIPLFKYFNQFIIDKYGLVKLGLFEQISKMECISINFLEQYSDEMKPYRHNIICDTYCPLEYILKNKLFVRKNRLWDRVLIENKNMTREFLIKHIRKSPNALIYHINILEDGDEILFKKYMRKLNWELFYTRFSGARLDINEILRYASKYLDSSKILKILEIQQENKNNTTN